MGTQSRISEIIIHYTATYADQAVSRETIDAWHKARGWKGIGYHYLIHQDGRLEIGRPLHEVGAHAPPNTGRVGICYVGGLKRSTGVNVGHDTRTPQQVATMTRLIFDLLAGRRDTSKVIVSPTARVLGHRDVGNTQCPGFDVPAWWASVRSGQPVAPMPSPPDKPSSPVRTEGVSEDPSKAADAAELGGVGAGGALVVYSFATGAKWAAVAAVVIAGVLIITRLLRSRR